MAARDQIRALAAGRIVIGAGLALAPRRAAGGWVGDDADTPGATVLARALGARDMVLGGMLLHTVDHPQVARRWTATCAAVDLVDGLAALSVRRDLPLVRGSFGLLVALGSAAAHALLARQITSADGLESVAARSTPEPASSPETVMPDGADEAKRAMGARTIGVDQPR